MLYIKIFVYICSVLLNKDNNFMDLIYCVNLQATLRALKAGDDCFVPAEMYKESAVRVAASLAGKRLKRDFSVAVGLKGCTITRNA